ncbi:MAG: hypothetical protein GXO40_03635 [Epsilonproteobacteria bacterium]|jgi:hypothetical protein|nr:hypothetical protein [Campylobacterota bacterium]
MLYDLIISINNTLDELIDITKQDIEDIKQARHTYLFNRNQQKDILIGKFADLKSQIDNILVQRSQKISDMSELLTPQEDAVFTDFRKKIQEFYKLHKKLEKMVLSVANFYNGLIHKINGSEVGIGYEISPSETSYFSLKG